MSTSYHAVVPQENDGRIAFQSVLTPRGSKLIGKWIGSEYGYIGTTFIEKSGLVSYVNPGVLDILNVRVKIAAFDESQDRFLVRHLAYTSPVECIMNVVDYDTWSVCFFAYFDDTSGVGGPEAHSIEMPITNGMPNWLLTPETKFTVRLTPVDKNKRTIFPPDLEIAKEGWYHDEME